MTDLPQPVTNDQQFLHEMCALLAEQNRLLARIHGLNEVKQPPVGTVELQLTEPAVPPESTRTTATVRQPRRGKRGNQP
jgi:hypothetical protein